MALFQGLIFLFFGVGLLIMDYQSLTRGWLPFGVSRSSESGRLEISKDRHGGLYWLLFMAYAAAGVALIILALRILTGNIEPLPL